MIDVVYGIGGISVPDHVRARLAPWSMAAALGLGVALAVAQVSHLVPSAQDAHVYYAAKPGYLYAERYAFAEEPFTYSPAFADVLAPFRLLPEHWFMALWQGGLIAVLVATIRAWALPVLLIDVAFLLSGVPVSLVLADIAMGNVHVLLGAAAVAGLRRPGVWAFALLSKLTPGVGLLWFLARREWRNLAVALGTTGTVALLSFVVIPGDWFEWVRFLAGGEDFPLPVIPVPLAVRLAMSAALLWWGARANHPWVVPVAVGWAIPIPYPTMTATMVCALAYASGRTPRSLRT
ncbi:MAG TPA: glycosyltransferase family 87 protein [Vicinamibacterales bacterium]